ncbi:hypothetical protein Tsubulata_004749 [Turnera subulata]|uniref:Uncharacterized protein n=1 Tax=Turnera subulata TaxID=218843 RepID=A0A9Q0FHE9_9ROSI|nr:hypothetical protein Tsubulata_004749 [Turnera subulata]
MQDQSSSVTYCPSFSSYSYNRTAETAARVINEVIEEEPDRAIFNNRNDTVPDEDDDDDEFEFVLVRASPEDAAVLASDKGRGEYFRPVFPLFNRDLLVDEDDVEEQIRIPLKNLFVSDDRDPPSSSASSEADELESAREGTFCLWNPSTPLRSPAASPARCQKSSSQGASSSKRRWRLRDLLRRCSSDGKQSLVFFSPKSDHNKVKQQEEVVKAEKTEKKAAKPAPSPKAKTASSAKEKVSAHEVFYVRRRASKEEDKKKSYLPYRLGFFANVNGFNKNFVPF